MGLCGGEKEEKHVEIKHTKGEIKEKKMLADN
jgi:hypothetical protein